MAKFVVIYDATIEKYKIHNINRTMMYGSDGLVTKLCTALCDPMDYSPQVSSVHGISQARILQWVAISSSRGSSPPRDET